MGDEQVSSPRRGGLLRSAGIVSVMTMLSRILGMVRDVVVARAFGAGSGADAFFVAFKIPNFFRRLFAEGAFSQAFVPVLAEYREKRAAAEVALLVSYASGTLAAVLTLLSLVAMAGAPWVIMVFAPGFSDMPEKQALAGEMLRITFPYLALVSLTAFAGSVLNSFDRYAIPAVTPIFLNLTMIGSTLFLAPLLDVPVVALAWGVLAAGVIQLFFQLPFLRQVGMLQRPRWGWSDPGVVQIRTLMLPAIFGVSVGQINMLLDTILASFLVDGSVSWLYYSERLMELPMGVFGVAIATVILPSLSRRHAESSGDAFTRTLDWGIRMVLLLGVPAALSLIVLAKPLMVTLFQYGKFSARDVEMSALSLYPYASGVVFFMLVKVLAPGYFARKDTATPVKIGIQATAAKMVFSLALVWPLAHQGLALSTALSGLINTTLLWVGLHKAGVYRAQPGWWTFLLRLLVANLVLLAVLSFMMGDWQTWLDWGWERRTAWLAAIVVAGAGSYFTVLYACGLRWRQMRGG
jgi:putative peptidoglycan lipid II flippase